MLPALLPATDIDCRGVAECTEAARGIQHGSSGPEGSEGLPEEDGFRFILVIMDDLSNFVSLEPAEACTAEVTAKYLLNWCKTMGVPRVWVSDTATHFKNRVIAQLGDALKVDHRSVAYTPWSIWYL